MKHLRLLSLILVLCFVSAIALTACEEVATESSAPSTSNGDASQDVSYGEYQDSNGKYYATPFGRYEGKTVTFLTCSVNPTYESEILYNPYADSSKKVYADGSTVSMPEVLNESLKLRAAVVEEILGLKVEEMKVLDSGRPGGGMAKAIREGNYASSTDYQIVVPCLYDGASLSVEGQLYNLMGDELNGLLLEAPWWNQEFNQSMTYAGQLYFTIGDLGIVNKSSTAALYVNLELWDKNGITDKLGGNPYELVRNGKWTVDTVFEAASLISKDEDNSGVIDYKDSFGWGGQLDDMWSIFYASGERIAKSDKDGYPILTMYNERSARLMEKM